MVIGHEIAAVLPELRAHAESLMVDAGRALRPSGGVVYADQQETREYVEVFTSRCKVKPRDLGVEAVEVGGRSAVRDRPVLHLPVSAPPLLPGDEWEITAVSPLSTVVVGRRYRVSGPFEKSLATARRYEVEEMVT